MRFYGRRHAIGAESFARAAYRYWRYAFPQACAELQKWRRHAARISDPSLRTAALCALDTKRCDLEGAVGFAAMFADLASLGPAVRAITSFQLAFDYLDCVVELQNADPVTNSWSLHRALFAALAIGDDHHDYYEHQPNQHDSGYLRLLVDSCRTTVHRLPAFAAIVPPLKRTMERVVTYQCLSHSDDPRSQASFVRWAESQVAPVSDISWWEAGAATGSQLTVLALIAVAADTTTHREHAEAIEIAYFPWIGALSTLLDSAVDWARDLAEGKPSLLDHYRSPQQTIERMRLMATESMTAVSPLSNAHKHRILLAAMGASFHARPETSESDANPITTAVVEALGAWTIPANAVIRAHRVVETTRTFRGLHNRRSNTRNADTSCAVSSNACAPE